MYFQSYEEYKAYCYINKLIPLPEEDLEFTNVGFECEIIPVGKKNSSDIFRTENSLKDIFSKISDDQGYLTPESIKLLKEEIRLDKYLHIDGIFTILGNKITLKEFTEFIKRW